MPTCAFTTVIGPAEDSGACPVTAATMAGLSANNPWHKLTETLKERLAKQQYASNQEAADVTRWSNEDLRTALKQAQARKVYNDNGHRQTHGAQRTSARLLNRDLQQQTGQMSLDPFKSILSLENPDEVHALQASLLDMKAHEAFPILAACCGHLPDDYARHCQVVDGACNRCNSVLEEGDSGKTRNSSWHRLWHRMVECPAEPEKNAALNEFVVQMQDIVPAQADLNQLVQQVLAGHKCKAGAFIKLLTNTPAHTDIPEDKREEVARLVQGLLRAGTMGAEEADDQATQAPLDSQTSIDDTAANQDTSCEGTGSEQEPMQNVPECPEGNEANEFELARECSLEAPPIVPDKRKLSARGRCRKVARYTSM